MEQTSARFNRKVGRRANYAFSFAPLESWGQGASGWPLTSKISTRGKKKYLRFCECGAGRQEERSFQPKSVKTSELCVFLCTIRILGTRSIRNTTHIKKFSGLEKVFSSILWVRSKQDEQNELSDAPFNRKVWRRANYSLSFAPLESLGQGAYETLLTSKNSPGSKKFFLRFSSEPARCATPPNKKTKNKKKGIGYKKREGCWLLVAGCFD